MEIINVGNRFNNNYMIKLKNGYLLIDTGYPEQFGRFRKKLKYLNIDLKDILYILLTHAHYDHAGFLNELLDYTEAKVILHRLSVDRLKMGQNIFDGGCTSYLALVFCKIMKLLGKGEHKFPPVLRLGRYIVLDDSTKQIVEQKLSGVIINLPGHTIDSIGLMLEDGSLFCGDAAMNGFPSLNRITIWIEDLKDFRRSWEIMINNNPTKIYPSHGEPFMKEDLKKNMHKINALNLYRLR